MYMKLLKHFLFHYNFNYIKCVDQFAKNCHLFLNRQYSGKKGRTCGEIVRNTTVTLKKSIHVESFCRSRETETLVVIRVYLDFS